MNDLIERLEKAAGPDREIDRDIGRALEPLPTEPFNGPSAWDLHKGMYWIIGKMDTKDGPQESKWGSRAASYTSSIDAALSLVRPAHEFEIGSAHLAECYWASVISAGGKWDGKSKTLPIALCIAALKSRAARS